MSECLGISIDSDKRLLLVNSDFVDKGLVILLQSFHLWSLEWVFAKMLLLCHHLGEKLVTLHSECRRTSFYTEMERLIMIAICVILRSCRDFKRL